MDERFVPDAQGQYWVPREIPPDGVTLFSIMHIDDARWLNYSAFAYARAFGLAWEEQGQALRQLFGYRVATPTEMERAFKKRKLPDDFGHDYLVYKSAVIGLEGRLLTDGLARTPEADCTLLGAKHTLIRHIPNAWREASFYTYKECRKEAEAISKRLGIPWREIIHTDIQYHLESDFELYKDFELMPFVLRPGRPKRAKSAVGGPVYKQLPLIYK